MRTSRLVFIALAAVTVLACGDPTAPKGYPTTAGVYVGTATFALTAVCSAPGACTSQPTSKSAGITITLSELDGSARVRGTYIFANNGGSGDIEGEMRKDGGVTISKFGDAQGNYLQYFFAACDVTEPIFDSGLSGSIVTSRLQLVGNDLLSCAIPDPDPKNIGRIITSQFTLSISLQGNR